VDSRTDSSQALGSFDRSLAASALLPPPNRDPVAFASAAASSRQIVTYAPGSITALITAETSIEQTLAYTAANATTSWNAEFQLGASDLPYRITGQGSGTINVGFDDPSSAGAHFLLIDLDTEDPDGGPLVIFGMATSADGSWAWPLDGSGTLLANHHYRLSIYVQANRELLNNPPLPDTVIRTATAVADFTLTLPEPSSLAALACAAPFLLTRRQHRAR
jgi:hypothetical protein